MEGRRSPAGNTALLRLIAVMARLRDPVDGCDWDRAQSHGSIAHYAIEEAFELVDAIDRGDAELIRDELGDLLLQVVFHSRIAEEAGHFDFADVATAVADKMERRHPHIFAGGPPEGWEAIKAQERGDAGAEGALAGVASTLPALTRAQKLGGRAAGVGFDWPDLDGVSAKLVEELEELRMAATAEEREDEFGDVLFTMASWARHIGIDAETALRAANRKFEERFRALEQDQPEFDRLDAAGKERAWQAVKARQRAEKRDQSASDIRTASAKDPSGPSDRSTTSPRS